jgi:hypothetical protein
LGNCICLLVNSVGGSLQAALGLHSGMARRPASRSVATVLYGLATSSAVLIGASGDFRVGLQQGPAMDYEQFGCSRPCPGVVFLEKARDLWPSQAESQVQGGASRIPRSWARPCLDQPPKAIARGSHSRPC